MERIVMKADFDSGDRKNKIPCKNKLTGCKWVNPFDTAFYKYNLNALNKFYEGMSHSMFNYYRNCSKAYEKVANLNKPSCCKKTCQKTSFQYNKCNKNEIKDILPVNGHDIFNYLTRHNMRKAQIQAVMKVDGRLDFDKLKKAVRLSVDAVPVLGCRFVEDDPPYWKRLDNIDEIAFCSIEETGYADEAVKMFLQSPLDMDNDPMVKVKVIRSKENDILAVKVNQICCDGTGFKEYIQLLAKIYSHLDKRTCTFMPFSREDSRHDEGKLFKELTVTLPDLRWNPVQEPRKVMWSFPWLKRGGDSVLFSVCRFPRESLDSICQYGKLKGATLNELILTAFYRVMFKTSMPRYGVPMDIFSTVDLRNFLPEKKNHAVRNLSGGFVTRIPRVLNESFEGTLTRVMQATEKMKNRHPGESNITGEENSEKAYFTYFNNFFEHMSQDSEITSQSSNYIGNVCFPGLYDIGHISDSLISFGSNVVTDAYVVPPVIRAPGLLLLAGIYNGILTLSVGYSRNSVSQRYMEVLLNKIKYELIRECTCNTVDEV